MSSPAYLLIRAAIEDKRILHATYQGHAREMCPHAIGLGPAGDEQVLVYQFAGTTSRGEISTLPEPDRWRCLHIAEVEVPTVVEGDWHTCDNHSMRNSCITDVDLEVVW